MNKIEVPNTAVKAASECVQARSPLLKNLGGSGLVRDACHALHHTHFQRSARRCTTTTGNWHLIYRLRSTWASRKDPLEKPQDLAVTNRKKAKARTACFLDRVPCYTPFPCVRVFPGLGRTCKSAKETYQLCYRAQSSVDGCFYDVVKKRSQRLLSIYL